MLKRGKAALSQDRVDAVAGSRLAFPSSSHKPSNGYLGNFKPWWDINYQGLLFFFDQDSRPGFDMAVFFPWFDLVSQGFLFTIK
ncbi:hypothetical protein ES703_87777 [subsurface metagenome]